jgi:hypothetical protein
LSYCPRSSLSAHVLDWLAGRLAHLLPPRSPGQGGTPPLSLEVRLDAVGAVILDGLSYRRAGRAVGISKTEVGDSLDLLLSPLAALGFCQPDGTFITGLDDLRGPLVEMAVSGEAVVVDGLATRVQRPRGWAVAVSTIHGDLLSATIGARYGTEILRSAAERVSWPGSRPSSMDLPTYPASQKGSSSVASRHVRRRPGRTRVRGTRPDSCAQAFVHFRADQARPCAHKLRNPASRTASMKFDTALAVSRGSPGPPLNRGVRYGAAALDLVR